LKLAKKLIEYEQRAVDAASGNRRLHPDSERDDSAA